MNIDLSSFRHFCSSLPHYRWAFSLVEFMLETNHIGNEGIRMLYLHLRIFHLSSDFGFMRLDLIMEAFSLLLLVSLYCVIWNCSLSHTTRSQSQVSQQVLLPFSPLWLPFLITVNSILIQSLFLFSMHSFLSCYCAESVSSLPFTTCWINGATLLMSSILGRCANDVRYHTSRAGLFYCFDVDFLDCLFPMFSIQSKLRSLCYSSFLVTCAVCFFPCVFDSFSNFSWTRCCVFAGGGNVVQFNSFHQLLLLFVFFKYFINPASFIDML